MKPKLPTDVQAAMSVLMRRDPDRDRAGAQLDLARTDLRGLALEDEANLQGASLEGTNFQGASLRGVDLQGAFLVGANLQGAYLPMRTSKAPAFRGANLQGALLRGANLQGARLLADANLQHPHYAADTRWPPGFDPITAGANSLDNDAGPGSGPPSD